MITAANRLRLALALLSTIACSASAFGPDGGAALQTDRTTYIASLERGEGGYRQYGFTIVTRFTNTSSHTIYLARCSPASPQPLYTVELLDSAGDAWGDAWGAAYNPAWACVGHDRQIDVAPGEVRIDTVHFAGPTAWDGVTRRPFGTLTGRMRLVYPAQSCRGDGECRLPASAGRSNAFEVDLAP